MIYVAMILTVLYLSYGTLIYGTRNSISKLAIDWNKWLFMLYIWTQAVLVAPAMFDSTPENLQWITFLTLAGLGITGAAAIDNKDDLKYHYIGAAISCLCSVIWLCIVNPILLIIPIIAVCAGGLNRIQWCGEIGIIAAVYLQLSL